jgi:hypothetical protein
MGLIVVAYIFGEENDRPAPRNPPASSVTADLPQPSRPPPVPQQANLPASPPVVSSVPAAAPDIRQVTATGVRLRAAPSTSAAVMGSYGRGTRAEVIGAVGDWLQVKIVDGGTIGWMHSQFLPKAGAAPTLAPRQQVAQPTPEKKVKKTGPSDAAIIKLIIAQSIASYPGSCPCPYNVDRGGRSCGRRSAWSKPGGYDPYCYPSDVPKALVEQYRERLAADSN